MKKISTLFIFIFLAGFFAGVSKAQTDDKSDKSKKQLKDRPLKITKKPKVNINVFSECSLNYRGKNLWVRLKVTFQSSGEITEVEIIKTSGCEYFDNEAVKVAKGIKFKSAIKDGEAITVTKILEYTAGIP